MNYRHGIHAVIEALKYGCCFVLGLFAFVGFCVLFSGEWHWIMTDKKTGGMAVYHQKQMFLLVPLELPQTLEGKE